MCVLFFYKKMRKDDDVDKEDADGDVKKHEGHVLLFVVIC